MQDRFKFRYVFTKDFGGKTGICYKMPIFNLDTITDENFNKTVKSYIDYDYKLISIEQSTGLKDKNGNLIYEGDRVYIDCEDVIATIRYSNDSAGFTIHFEDEKVVADFDNYYGKELEVIGNIYEDKQ